MNKKITFLLTFVWVNLLLPLNIFAAGPVLGEGKVIDAKIFFDKIFNAIWPFFLGFAVLMFIIAGFMFVTSSGDATKAKKARDAVLWGVAGLVVAILSFSIPTVVSQILGV